MLILFPFIIELVIEVFHFVQPLPKGCNFVHFLGGDLLGEACLHACIELVADLFLREVQGVPWSSEFLDWRATA
jgi:hypothetical protein